MYETDDNYDNNNELFAFGLIILSHHKMFQIKKKKFSR
jgi:hypothetical protein